MQRYPDDGAARRAILDHKISGALVPGPRHLTVLTAGADGPAAAAAITEAGRAAALTGDRTVTTLDLRPLVREDPRGVAFNLMLLPLVITGIASAVLVDRAAPRLGAWTRAGVLAGFALTGGLVTALIARPWLAVVPGPLLGVAGLATLLLLAVTLSTHALIVLAGPPGTSLAVLVFLIVGNVGSGAATAPSMLPGFWRTIGPYLPPGAGATGLRNTAYFHGADLLRPLLVLVAFIAGGLVVLAATSRGRPTQGRTCGAYEQASCYLCVRSSCTDR